MSPVVVDRKTHLGVPLRVQLGLVESTSSSCTEFDLEALARRFFNTSQTSPGSADLEYSDLVLDLDIGLDLKMLGDMPFSYSWSQSLSLDTTVKPAGTNSQTPSNSSNSSSESDSAKQCLQCLFTMFDDECCVPLNEGFAVNFLDLAVEDSQHALQLSASLSLNVSSVTVLLDTSDIVVVQSSSGSSSPSVVCDSILALRATFETVSNHALPPQHEGGGCFEGSRAKAGIPRQFDQLGGVELHVDPVFARHNGSVLCGGAMDATSGAAYSSRVRLVVFRKDALPLLQALHKGVTRQVAYAVYMCACV
jgi:hypothetical protein